MWLGSRTECCFSVRCGSPATSWRLWSTGRSCPPIARTGSLPSAGPRCPLSLVPTLPPRTCYVTSKTLQSCNSKTLQVGHRVGGDGPVVLGADGELVAEQLQPHSLAQVLWGHRQGVSPEGDGASPVHSPGALHRQQGGQLWGSGARAAPIVLSRCPGPAPIWWTPRWCGW